ncbi:hypothetical protein ABFX02_08G105600 [Erythranthe guttata]
MGQPPPVCISFLFNITFFFSFTSIAKRRLRLRLAEKSSPPHIILVHYYNVPKSSISSVTEHAPPFDLLTQGRQLLLLSRHLQFMTRSSIIYCSEYPVPEG